MWTRFFLTRWLPMTNIFVMWRIFSNQFKCSHLRNEKLFLNFSLRFWNLHQILNILKKKSLIAYVFPKILPPKVGITEMYKRSCFRKPFGNQRVKANRIHGGHQSRNRRMTLEEYFRCHWDCKRCRVEARNNMSNWDLLLTFFWN